jgi:uncharacterized protein YuzE
MKVMYFKDTDTLYIEFQAQDVVESRDLDENTIMDLDAEGGVCAITFEHASTRTDVQKISLEGIAA